MTDPHFCQHPGCGLPMDEQLTRCLDANDNAEIAYVCPRGADAHALCKRNAELEAKLAASEALGLALEQKVIKLTDQRDTAYGYGNDGGMPPWME